MHVHVSNLASYHHPTHHSSGSIIIVYMFPYCPTGQGRFVYNNIFIIIPCDTTMNMMILHDMQYAISQWVRFPCSLLHPTFHPPTHHSSGSCIIVHIPRLWMTTQKCGFWKVDFCTLTSQLGLSHTSLFCQHHHSMHVPWPWQGPCTRIYLLLSVHLPILYIAHIRMVIQKVGLERLIFVCSLSQLDPPTGHPTIWYHHSMHVPSRIHHPWR